MLGYFGEYKVTFIKQKKNTQIYFPWSFLQAIFQSLIYAPQLGTEKILQS